MELSPFTKGTVGDIMSSVYNKRTVHCRLYVLRFQTLVNDECTGNVTQGVYRRQN